MPFTLRTACATMILWLFALIQVNAQWQQIDQQSPVFQVDTFFVALPDSTALADARTTPARIPISGLSMPVEVRLGQQGQWRAIAGGRVWQLAFRANRAKGINLYFKEIRLGTGGSIRFRNEEGETVFGPFSAEQVNGGLMSASPLVLGEGLLVELFEPHAQRGFSALQIGEVGYFFGDVGFEGKQRKGFGDAGGCQVNVGCEEGDLWREISPAVVRILVKNRDRLGWCTGTLINNAKQDFIPYILTAMHCALNDFTGTIIPQTDVDQWIFYFNYQASGCQSPLTEGTLANQFLIGAQTVSFSDDEGGETGSDFLLLRLKQNVPSTYNAVYAGWNLTPNGAQQGVTLHHPSGDLKKVSTFNTGTKSSTFGEKTPDTHWEVGWRATTNGHGTTQGGSSGAPLFDEGGRIIGTLTGGFSSCSSRTRNDFFGKLSYSWQSNGTAANRRLRPWLDPDGTGVLRMASVRGNGQVVTGLKDEGIEEEVVIYPNPSRGSIHIEWSGAVPQGWQTQLMDLSGRLIDRRAWSGLTAKWEITGIAPGLYLLCIDTPDGRLTRKIVIE